MTSLNFSEIRSHANLIGGGQTLFPNIDYELNAIPGKFSDVQNSGKKFINQHQISPHLLKHSMIIGTLGQVISGYWGNNQKVQTVGQWKSTFQQEGFGYRFNPIDVRLLNDVYKGVSAKLPLAMIGYGLDEFCKNNRFVAHSISTCFIESDLVVPFTTKNIVRHLKYPILDAMNLYRNIRANYNFHEIRKLFLIINTKSVDLHNITINPVNGTAAWGLPTRLKDANTMAEMVRDDKYEELSCILDAMPCGIPIRSLKLWRQISKEHFEDSEKRAWSELPVPSQRRRVINTIRHNAIYEEIYDSVRLEYKSIIHDLLFEKLCREICKEFPALRTEVQRQLDKLDRKRDRTEWLYKERVNE